MSLIAYYLLSFLTDSRVILYFFLLYPLHFLPWSSNLMPSIVLFILSFLILRVCKILWLCVNLFILTFCNLIVFIHLMSKLLPLWHMSRLFIPLLLAYSELWVLLSILLSCMVRPALFIVTLIHIENVNILGTLVLNISLAGNSLEFLNNELFRFSLFKFPTAHIQLVDILDDIELVTGHSQLVFVIQWVSFILKIHRLKFITISLYVTVDIRSRWIVKDLTLNRSFSKLHISLY